ncbi:response regulator [Bradyrhizobium sp. CCGB01]|nr:response regulator [Bradyrhizobium sp. CCGB20]MCP3406415.1 response regulator [Bradyrhizobium sp. CCGB01]
MVRELGFEAIEAADADEAIELLERRNDIDILFTDIQMPGSMNGLRLIAVVRDRWPPILLLVTSGQSRLPATRCLRERGSCPNHTCKTNLSLILRRS